MKRRSWWAGGLVGVSVLAFVLPAGAGDKEVFIADPVNILSRARVDSGSLRVGDGDGPLTVDVQGPVTVDGTVSVAGPVSLAEPVDVQGTVSVSDPVETHPGLAPGAFTWSGIWLPGGRHDLHRNPIPPGAKVAIGSLRLTNHVASEDAFVSVVITQLTAGESLCPTYLFNPPDPIAIHDVGLYVRMEPMGDQHLTFPEPIVLSPLTTPWCVSIQAGPDEPGSGGSALATGFIAG